jgi:hypothetical protein
MAISFALKSSVHFGALLDDDFLSGPGAEYSFSSDYTFEDPVIKASAILSKSGRASSESKTPSALGLTFVPVPAGPDALSGLFAEAAKGDSELNIFLKSGVTESHNSPLLVYPTFAF